MTTERRAISPTIRVGASGKFWGLRLSDNKPMEAEGVIKRIQESSWISLTIQAKDGTLVRIRMA